MDAATAALIGTAIGGLSSLAVAALGTRQARRARAEERRHDLDTERRATYIRFLTHSRDVRYAALRAYQQRAFRSVGEVDALLTQLSSAFYMIALMAPDEIVADAQALREAVFDLWRLARDEPNADPDVWRAQLERVWAAQRGFRQLVRRELHLTRHSGTPPRECARLPP
ncbi:MAG TPA: hypothetical protein VFX21_12725 [Acidimicrobiia bacterium]|nr:hypothetical protein [Acidimicrobiia bacterium]